MNPISKMWTRGQQHSCHHQQQYRCLLEERPSLSLNSEVKYGKTFRVMPFQYIIYTLFLSLHPVWNMRSRVSIEHSFVYMGNKSSLLGQYRRPMNDHNPILISRNSWLCDGKVHLWEVQKSVGKVDRAAGGAEEACPKPAGQPCCQGGRRQQQPAPWNI